MPKYKNVTVASMAIRNGKGRCTVRQGKKSAHFDCNGVYVEAVKIKKAGITKTSSGFTFGKNVTCEIDTAESLATGLLCRKGGK